MRFLNFYPEGMPTIPTRRSIMAGRRMFPFRGWKPKWDDLPPQPGWEPVGSDGEMWTEVLGRNGWTTGYVTDNPHLLLGVHKSFRGSFDRVELVDGQVPVRKPKAGSAGGSSTTSAAVDAGQPRRAAHGHLPGDQPAPEVRGGVQRREGLPTGMSWVEWARARQPFALVIDSFDAHEPWDAPRRLVDMYGPPRSTGSSRFSPSRRRPPAGASSG